MDQADEGTSSQQEERVHVDISHPSPEMEMRRRPPGMPRSGRPDDLTRADVVTRPDGLGGEPGIRRSHAVGMVDGNVEGTRDPSREGDSSEPRCADRRSDRGRDVDPPMTRSEGRARWLERADDRAAHGPDVRTPSRALRPSLAAGSSRPSACGRNRKEDDGDDDGRPNPACRHACTSGARRSGHAVSLSGGYDRNSGQASLRSTSESRRLCTAFVWI